MSILTPQFLKQIHRCRIRSQSTFRGMFKGERRSLNRGAGVEFADYRPYEMGDDLRYVDWNIYARLDRLFVKLFRAEEDLSISILLDISQSMDFGEPTKMSCAKQIAAALGYIGLVNFDRVSIYTMSEQIQPITAPIYGRRQFAKLSKTLEAVGVAGRTDLTTCLKRFARYSPQLGVVIVISDFWDMNGYESGMKYLLGRGFALTLIHLLSHEELHPSLSGEWRLEDAETGHAKEITINEQAITYYQKRLDAFCQSLKRFCMNRGANYARISNRASIESLILQELRRIGLVQR